MILSTSGVYAGLGQPETDAVKAYEKHQPSGTRKIQFVYENDQSDPAQGAALAKQLVADPDVVGIIGGATIAVANGIAPVVQSAKVPWITLTPNPYPNYNKDPNSFGPNIGPIKNHGEMHAQMVTLLGADPSKSAVLINDDATGQATQAAFTAFKDFVATPASLTDYAPTIAKLKSSDAEAIVDNQSGANAAYARTAQVAAALDIPFLGGPQVLTDSFVNIAGKAADGIYILGQKAQLAEALPDTDPKQVTQVNDYRAALQAQGDDPSLASSGPINAWDAALSFGYAGLGKSGASRSAIQKAMIDQTYFGAGGEVKRTESDHAGFQQDSWVYLEYTGGKVIAAAESKDGKLSLVNK